MKASILLLVSLTLVASLALAASAQESSAQAPASTQAHNLRESRSTKQEAGVHRTAQRRTHAEAHRTPRKDALATDMTIIHAQGNPYMVDFLAASNKRADLRMDAARRGLDAAFSEWLHRERPLTYKEYVEEALKANKENNIEKNHYRPSVPVPVIDPAGSTIA